MGDSTPIPIPIGNNFNPSTGMRPGALNQSSDPALDTDARVAQQDKSQQTPPPNTNYSQYSTFSPQQNVSQHRPDAFNMANMGGALPDMQYQNYNMIQQRQMPGHPPSYMIQSIAQFPASQVSNPSMIAYSIPYQGQFNTLYPTGHGSSSHQMQPPTNGNQFYQGQGYAGQSQQPSSPYYLQQNQYGPQPHAFTVPSSQYASKGLYSSEVRQQPQQGADHLSRGTSGAGRPNSTVSSAGKSSVVRGPPRKPRQTGNLPPQTELMSLVLHVCKETPGLESLFLISKSNCAFANFKDEATCTTAQAKIHDSRFQIVRLVSRLRRNPAAAGAGIDAPTGPAALTQPSSNVVARTPTPENEESVKEGVKQIAQGENKLEEGAAKDKFFVVKSLTVEDLELSVRNGIWATQSHNEQALNKAYETADNVYLVFSANKSGEYFGYARMISPINDDPAAAIEFAPKPQSVEDPDLPKAISTAATEIAPKGRIIDDSARGTIFWEVERDEADAEEDEEEQSDKEDQDGDAPNSKAWGKPFKIEWVSTMRLPFYRTRGLRNPWNSNREIKIARDGTELETSIGRRLLGLFHRVPITTAPQMLNNPLPSVGGYPQMHSYQ
ncbi:hypothetical protein HYALB_00006560 [Hymenoscyphus albidus]|uniref:YTH domain-containing protein n=1 Tax=Hymenoscyphus albidus TaxID=595503 RepID=A0A9N9Q0Q6_9HELO|nr:hypothetical protein HYALB_00006560 [Hymenoscyphus albidus]